MHQQIVIILLHIDIGLVNTLVLQSANMWHDVPLSSSKWRGIEWIDQMDVDLFKDLMDGIDMQKIENLIFDED